MNLLDLRTVLISYVVSNAICASVVGSLWLQHRRRSPELGFWLADFVMQFVAVLLIVLRGSVPDWASIVIGGGLAVGGALLLYMGLERYVGQPSSQRHNYVLLTIFLLVHAYFTFVQPSLLARNLNVSVGLLVMCGQCAWLMLRRVAADLRPAARLAGVTFAAYSLVSLVRIPFDLSTPSGNDLFKSGLYDTLVVLIYQMLFIALTFTLFLMVNRRLQAELEHDITERKQAEAALKQSKEKFSIAFQNVPDAIALTSVADGKIVEVNDSFFRVAELARDDIVGQTTLDLNLWANLADRTRYAEELQRQGRVLNFETSFRRSSGVCFPALISGEIIQLPEGQCALNVIRDITEQRRVEQVLEERHALLDALINSPPDIIIFSLDKDYCYTAFNEKHRAAMRAVWQADIALGMNLLEAMTVPDLRAAAKGSFDRVLHGETFVEIQHQPGPDIYYEFNWSPIRRDNGDVVGITAFILDITERKRAEAALRESEDRYRGLFEHMAEGYAYCRMVFEDGQPIDWIYLAVNESFGTLTGLKDVSGKRVSEVIPGIRETDPELFAAYARVALTGQHERFEIFVEALQMWFAISVYSPAQAYFVAVFDVVTERKRAEAQILAAHTELQRLLAEADQSRHALLSVVEDQKIAAEEIQRLNAELEQRVIERTAELEATNKELEAFTYSVSHDLRAPLRAIDGYTRILLEDYAAAFDNEGRNIANIVRDETQRMGRLIDDLLTLSRLSRTAMKIAPIDMQALVHSIYHQLTTPAARARIDFRVSALPIAECDMVLIQRAWENLLANAIKFSGRRTRAVIEVTGTSTDSEVIYCVRDNGAGFDMEYARKLFGVFQRLHSDREFEGTGVGLAIVQRVVHRHGGRVWGEGQVDAGAAFYFALPIQRSPND